uniref:Ring finger protein 31 n=1 Tax=Oryctolagus cuniculus TaxID=9986 RepID=A0A5F9C7R9_RABIT
MPGKEEERAFLAAREELASALRRDSGQMFSLEQLRPLLATSLPPAARYLQLDAARLIRCNAHGEPRNYLSTLPGTVLPVPVWSDGFWQSTHSPAGAEQSWRWRCCRRLPGTMSWGTWWKL